MKKQSPAVLAVIVALGGFIFGFDASVISGVIVYVSSEFSLNVWQQGFVVGAPALAAAVGALALGPLSDLFGRKTMLIVVASLYLVSAIASALAFDFYSLLIARCIGGAAFASLMIAPIYISEISPAKERGRLVSVNQLNIVVGLSAAYFTNYLIVRLNGLESGLLEQIALGENLWRYMLGLEIMPALVWLTLLFFVPESPRWLYVKGQKKKALVLMEKYYDGEEVSSTVEQMEQTDFGLEYSAKTLLKDLFGSRLRKILLIAFFVAVIQQATGINAVFFFATSIFELSGVGRDAAFAQAAWVGVINLVFTVTAMLLVDRIGRKPLLIIGLAAIFISMSFTSLGFYNASFQITDHTRVIVSEINPEASGKLDMSAEFDNDLDFREYMESIIGKEKLSGSYGMLVESSISVNALMVLAGILGFVSAFAISLGPIMWIILSEVFPNHLRGVAMAVVGTINTLTSFMVQFLFPWELSVLGNSATFGIYAVIALISIPVIIRFLPETKNLTLEQIQLRIDQK